ncbi:MAG TPA: bacteriohopanetetrol glucosamine biosynthesis glycosyltransferase HpnI [Blastocatellia bacterium]|nr:bacteriohopanetetrol glucosamine biosynthesis glycosyltransferase HpnI [Blastocatellia bacterium]
MKTWLLLGALVVFSSLGEILSSRGMKQVGHISFRPGHLFESIARAVRNPSLIASIVCLAFAFFSFLALLSYADLSFVIPLTAVTYLTNTLGAKLWLKEKITTARLAGTLMVTFGVVIVTLPQNFEATIISSVNGFFQNLIAALTGGEMLSAATPLTGWLLFALRAALLVCVIAAVVYYGISLVAGWLWSRDRRRQRALGTDFTPPVTILIPVRGADHNTHENFASFCRQDYPEFQIVFGVREADDPAVRVIRKLQGDFPARQIELVISPTEIGYNAKVSNLQNMYARAGHDLLIIVDSDIRVGPDYLRRVVAPMRRPGVGMVTCLYRGAGAETAAALVENIGISSTFSAEVVTARALEGIRFALGSTILTRRELLEKIGGFHAVADYLADDFLLGNYAAEAGCEVVLSDYVVEHLSGPDTFATMLRHQLRWGRSTRISRPKGYAGLILTYGTATSLLLLVALGFSAFGWVIFAITMAVRMLTAWCFGVVALGDRVLAKNFLLVPLRDLIGFGVWAASFVGDEIQWRGTTFRVLPSGKIRPVGQS